MAGLERGGASRAAGRECEHGATARRFALVLFRTSPVFERRGSSRMNEVPLRETNAGKTASRANQMRAWQQNERYQGSFTRTTPRRPSVFLPNAAMVPFRLIAGRASNVHPCSATTSASTVYCLPSQTNTPSAPSPTT
jgi:hypothetical protein